MFSLWSLNNKSRAQWHPPPLVLFRLDFAGRQDPYQWDRQDCVMSACGFDNHLRRQLPDRQEQQTKETRMHLLAEKSLICQADESGSHIKRCCANCVHECQKEGGCLERGINVYACVRAGGCLYACRNSPTAVRPCIERMFMINISACLRLAQKGDTEQEGRWTISTPISDFKWVCSPPHKEWKADPVASRDGNDPKRRYYKFPQNQSSTSGSGNNVSYGHSYMILLCV